MLKVYPIFLTLMSAFLLFLQAKMEAEWGDLASHKLF